MPRGRAHDPEIKAAAIRLYLQNYSLAAIERALGVKWRTVKVWVDEYTNSATGKTLAQYELSREELGQRVYATIIETLESLRARARETGRAEWIKAQTADQIAALDSAQWDRVIRLIAAFQPVGEAAAEPGVAEADVIEVRPHTDRRNGAVDPAG